MFVIFPGLCSSLPAGREFATSFMQNLGSDDSATHFIIEVTALPTSQGSTKVKVTAGGQVNEKEILVRVYRSSYQTVKRCKAVKGPVRLCWLRLAKMSPWCLSTLRNTRQTPLWFTQWRTGGLNNSSSLRPALRVALLKSFLSSTIRSKTLLSFTCRALSCSKGNITGKEARWP